MSLARKDRESSWMAREIGSIVRRLITRRSSNGGDTDQRGSEQLCSDCRTSSRLRSRGKHDECARSCWHRERRSRLSRFLSHVALDGINSERYAR